MKKRSLGVILTLILFSCVFCFSACVPLSIFDLHLEKYEGILQDNSIISLDTDGLTTQQTKTEIAEKYISISFTVLIAQSTTTNVYNSSTNALISTDESHTFVSFGSGVVVKTGGYIATNYHVIAKTFAEPETSTKTVNGQKTETIKNYVAYCSQDGGDTAYEAEVLWYNDNYDMAIIVCPHYADLPAAPMKDRSVYCSNADRIKVLEEIITVGTQKECANYNSATVGTISSSENRSIYGADLGINYEYLIQHTAAINHGNSGGALVDMDGYLIGLNTLGDDNANSIFYAISIYPIIQVIDTVSANWETDGSTTTDYTFGFVGYDKLEYQNFPTAKKTNIPSYVADFDSYGLIVTKINENIAIADLQEKDVIVKITFSDEDSDTEFTINNRYDLLNARLQLYTYTSATVTVLRDGEEVNLTLTRG